MLEHKCSYTLFL